MLNKLRRWMAGDVSGEAEIMRLRQARNRAQVQYRRTCEALKVKRRQCKELQELVASLREQLDDAETGRRSGEADIKVATAENKGLWAVVDKFTNIWIRDAKLANQDAVGEDVADRLVGMVEERLAGE